VGDQSAFENYVAKMRTDGEWGDHVEIQAMSEIYNRPIEIYAYNDGNFQLISLKLLIF
jgi:hypothetical protein